MLQISDQQYLGRVFYSISGPLTFIMCEDKKQNIDGFMNRMI